LCGIRCCYKALHYFIYSVYIGKSIFQGWKIICPFHNQWWTRSSLSCTMCCGLFVWSGLWYSDPSIGRLARFFDRAKDKKGTYVCCVCGSRSVLISLLKNFTIILKHCIVLKFFKFLFEELSHIPLMCAISKYVWVCLLEAFQGLQLHETCLPCAIYLFTTSQAHELLTRPTFLIQSMYLLQLYDFHALQGHAISS